MEGAFRWGTTLGVGSALFLFAGFVYLAIGLATPFALATAAGSTQMVISPRSDRILYGGDSSDLLSADPKLATLRRTLLLMVAGGLVALGVCELTISWFGLRSGHWWAWWALVVSGVAVLPYWVMATSAYRAAGISLTLGDLPPYWWVPAILLSPAAALSAFGLRGA